MIPSVHLQGKQPSTEWTALFFVYVRRLTHSLPYQGFFCLKKLFFQSTSIMSTSCLFDSVSIFLLQLCPWHSLWMESSQIQSSWLLAGMLWQHSRLREFLNLKIKSILCLCFQTQAWLFPALFSGWTSEWKDVVYWRARSGLRGTQELPQQPLLLWVPAL